MGGHQEREVVPVAPLVLQNAPPALPNPQPALPNVQPPNVQPALPNALQNLMTINYNPKITEFDELSCVICMSE